MKLLNCFKTKNWVEIIDDARGMKSTNSQTKLKSTMLKSSLCDYIDAYILLKRTITITAAGADAAAKHEDEKNKQVILTNCEPLPDYTNKINNTAQK